MIGLKQDNHGKITSVMFFARLAIIEWLSFFSKIKKSRVVILGITCYHLIEVSVYSSIRRLRESAEITATEGISYETS